MSGFIPSTGNLIDVYRLEDYDDVGTPDAPFEISIRPERNGTGTATFSIPIDDSLYGSVQINDVAAFRRDVSGTLTTVAAMIVEQIAEHTLDTEGGAKRVATYSGRLLPAFMEWALVYPHGGPGRKPIEEDSVWDWRSRRYQPAFYPSGPWDAADEIMTVADAAAGDWPHQPMGEGFDLTSGAYMILDGVGTDTYAPKGWYLFYRDITIAETGRHGIEVLADDKGYMWIDGAQQLEIRLEDGFITASFKWLELTAGVHRFAWAVFNVEDPDNPGDGLGPAALAYNLYKSDLGGRPLAGAQYEISDANTKVLYMDEDPWPGMSVGDIIDRCLAEAQTRGGLGWLYINNFDTLNDSDGAEWPLEPGITTKVGTPVLQFLDELVASGRLARWEIGLDGGQLRAFAPGYTTRPGDFEFTEADPDDPLTGQLLQLDRVVT